MSKSYTTDTVLQRASDELMQSERTAEDVFKWIKAVADIPYEEGRDITEETIRQSLRDAERNAMQEAEDEAWNREHDDPPGFDPMFLF